MDNEKVRFSSAPWFGLERNIIVGGVGGIGTWVALFLSRIGHTIYIYDDDTIDQTNMGGQLYRTNSIGKSKVEECKSVCDSFSSSSNRKTQSVRSLYSKDSLATPVMFSCFDSIDARRIMFENWMELGDDRQIYLDGRMEAELGEVYVVTKENAEDYRKTLFTAGEGNIPQCSFKATTHNGAMIASLMVSCLNNYLSNVKFEEYIRDVPFSIKYNLDIMDFRIQNKYNDD